MWDFSPFENIGRVFFRVDISIRWGAVGDWCGCTYNKICLWLIYSIFPFNLSVRLAVNFPVLVVLLFNLATTVMLPGELFAWLCEPSGGNITFSISSEPFFELSTYMLQILCGCFASVLCQLSEFCPWLRSIEKANSDLLTYSINNFITFSHNRWKILFETILSLNVRSLQNSFYTWQSCILLPFCRWK